MCIYNMFLYIGAYIYIYMQMLTSVCIQIFSLPIYIPVYCGMYILIISLSLSLALYLYGPLSLSGSLSPSLHIWVYVCLGTDEGCFRGQLAAHQSLKPDNLYVWEPHFCFSWHSRVMRCRTQSAPIGNLFLTSEQFGSCRPDSTLTAIHWQIQHVPLR